MQDLKSGSFYWVKPVFDVDFTPPGFENIEWNDAAFEASINNWRQQDQPARFVGYDINEQEIWLFIGVEDDKPWPVCWIGAEIKQ
jgi:hypothetical protein